MRKILKKKGAVLWALIFCLAFAAGHSAARLSVPASSVPVSSADNWGLSFQALTPTMSVKQKKKSFI